MRLDKLRIRSRFKNLEGFSIDFDQDSPTTVLVGRNGAGKSNLLEALTVIFRDLDLGEKPAFSYELDYICRGKRIHVDADPDRHSGKGYEISADDKRMTLEALSSDPENRLLPNYVFGYYSGSSNRMEDHFVKHQKRFYDALLKDKEQPLRPLLFARPVHSQFVLLAFFIEDDSKVKDFLRDELRIDGLDYALFVMRQPSWKNKAGDERFWYARGVVSGFLDKLYELAIAPLRRTKQVSTSFRTHTTLEHLYLFLSDLESIRKLAGIYPSQQNFFKALESTYISELISEVTISVRARKADGTLTFRQMSEGEQQLLMVLGLLRFTREEESLFLLDEPDTHLNPAWSIKYLDFLKDIGGAQENSHIIMATHDPLVIAGLTRSQVQIFERDEETGRITAASPECDPRGMGVAALLTSDVYGLRSQLDLETLHDLDRKRELAAKDVRTPKEKEELHELTEELSGLDFTNATRDPLYSEFVKLMHPREKEAGLQKPILSPKEKRKQRELAMQIIAELKSKEGKSS